MDLGKVAFDIDTILGSSTKHISQTVQVKGCLCYISGCYIIFYSPLLDEQIAYIKHSSSNISALAVCSQGMLLAVAQRGKYPTICVYDVQNIQKICGEIKTSKWQLKGHKYSVDIVQFSPNRRYILSISNHDGSMFLWERGETVSKNKITKTINKAIFDHNGDLITVGRGYFKFWKFNNGEAIRKKEDDYWMIEGRVMTFGKKFTTKQFIDVAIYRKEEGKIDQERDKVILLSNDGLLCIMQINYEKVEKWIDLMMEKTTSIDLYQNLALCSGNNALIKVIDLDTLSLKAKFPKPPPTNKENISKDQTLEYNDNQQFPHCLGIRRIGDTVATLYQNKTIFVWKIGEQILPVRSIITHREKINSVCLLEEVKGDITFFSTVSEDNTLRIWHFYKKEYEGNHSSIDIAEAIGIKRNLFCKNLTRIIYTDSEHPIIKMKMYQKNSIACISKQEFLMYSLEDFDLIIHDTFQQENLKNSNVKKALVSLETLQELIYIGHENGILKVYKPAGERLCKMKEIQMDMPIDYLQIFQKNKVLAFGRGKAKCYNTQGDLIMNQYNIECCTASNNYIILGEKKALCFFSIIKQKKISTLSLTHELEQNEHLSQIRSNSWLIAVLTSKHKIIVANFSSTVIYSEQSNQVITDLQITENGEIIEITQNGTIIIKKMEKDNKYQKVEEKAKKWFQNNDMSWMDGSVWVSSKNKSNSNLKIKKSLEIQGVENQNSIRLSQEPDQQYLSDKSIGLNNYQIANVSLEYKTQQNKRSVFNPSNIYQQVNKIYNDMNLIMKNYKKGERGEIKKQQAPKLENIQLEQSVDEVQFESMSQQKQKRRIFGGGEKQKQGAYVPKFANNLVESVIQSDKSKHNPSLEKQEKSTAKAQESINFGFSQFMQQKPPQLQFDSKKQDKLTYTQSQNKFYNSSNDIVSSLKSLLDNYESIKDNKEYVHALVIEHYEEYSQIYNLLDKVFGDEKRRGTKKQILEKYTKLSALFVNQVLEIE